MAKAMNGAIKQVLLVGCEPLTLGGEEGCIGLSDEVEGALDDAVEKISAVVDRILNGKEI
jgi:hydrogenase maturation protease